MLFSPMELSVTATVYEIRHLISVSVRLNTVYVRAEGCFLFEAHEEAHPRGAFVYAIQCTHIFGNSSGTTKTSVRMYMMLTEM